MAEPIVIIDSDDDCPTNPKEQQSSTEKEQMECPICLQSCIHPARLPCGHIFCFLCVKGVAYKNRRCAMCRREIPVEFLDHPQLVYSIQETGATTSDGYQWFYEGRNGWWQYDERTCQDIEEAYKKGEKFCTILVAGYVYVVDFETMLQQRQNDPSRKRQVKRDLATTPKKGVAGLRIDGTTEPHSSRGTDASSSSSSTTLTQPMIRSNIISTIAATDAAIRIATDIIDSTLAHADEYRSDANSSSRSNSSSSGTDHTDLDGSSNSDLEGSRLDLLHEVEETLNISNASGLSTTAQNLDFFSSTIDEFRSLALSNLAQSSSDDSDNDNDYDCNDSTQDTDHSNAL